MAAEPGTSTPPLYDVHTHVLFDIDDGATDEEMSLAMLRIAAERGVIGTVATPHSLDVAEHGGVATLTGRLERIRTLLDEQGVAMELLPGMEVHLMPDVPERLAQGDYLPVNGSRYVLTELDFVSWANYTDEVLFQMDLAGHRPLLAHVERIGPLQEHPERLQNLVERGYFAQVTAASLLGMMGPEPQHVAETMIAKNLVHVIASDAHRPEGNRGPLLAAAHAKLVELAGDDAAHAMLYVNPASVVRDEPLTTVEPPPKRRRWFLGRS